MSAYKTDKEEHNWKEDIESKSFHIVYPSDDFC